MKREFGPSCFCFHLFRRKLTDFVLFPLKRYVRVFSIDKFNNSGILIIEDLCSLKIGENKYKKDLCGVEETLSNDRQLFHQLNNFDGGNQ